MQVNITEIYQNQHLEYSTLFVIYSFTGQAEKFILNDSWAQIDLKYHA